jgi:hypothetical protein
MGALGWFSAAFLSRSLACETRLAKMSGGKASTESEILHLSHCFDALSSHEGLSAQLEIATVSVGLPGESK